MNKLTEFSTDTLEATSKAALDAAVRNILSHQHANGYWVYELEADCTIPSEYIMMRHYVDDIDTALETKIGCYLRARQNTDGSWPLYTGGEGDLSCTIKTYYALKLAGDDIDSAHMEQARRYVLVHGGAAHANVFTRIALAMFEQLPWRGVPYIPVEIMLLPKWFFFHLSKVSYWSRTVMVPLFVLTTLKVKAKNPKKIGVAELFHVDPEQETSYFDSIQTRTGKFFLLLDKIGRTFIEPLIPKAMRRRATRLALEWFEARLNGEDGLGAIFPAMVNAYEAMLALGIPPSDPRVVTARRAIDLLVVEHDDYAYCQPCASPIWDTGLATLSLQEVLRTSHDATISKAVENALRWCASKQLTTDEAGDWRDSAPDIAGGGWAFQFNNSYYPDVDDTAVIAYAMMQSQAPEFADNVRRAADWVNGMQSAGGGFAAFDVDNTHYYLNSIPFADHGALLDPPTVDVSARCLMLLAPLAKRDARYQPAVDRCLDYIWREQESDGSWFGRWGSNYIYGAWSVLIALQAAGVAMNQPRVQKAIVWLKSKQRADGGWGETQDSYADRSLHGTALASTAFQTAWALLGLLAAEGRSPEVERGIAFLTRAQAADGVWYDNYFTAPGFPKVFYLKYHGYDKYFPLWALARYLAADLATNSCPSA